MFRSLQRPAPETYAFAALLLVFGFLHLHFPTVKWDARSIWLFRAKELFFEGHFSRADALRAEYAWSHPDYPLLLPSWSALYSSLEAESFSERLASLGGWVIFSALSARLWLLSRQAYGRVVGSLFVVTLVLGISVAVTGGLADGFLLLMLLVAFLAGRSNQNAPLARCALVTASLLKWEGLVFALVLLALSDARKRLHLWLIFLPAFAYLGWTRALHLPTDFAEIHWGAIAGTLFPRTETVLTGMKSNLLESYFLTAGAVALATALACGIRERSIMLMICGILAFVFIAFLLTPKDLAWHIQTAMGRLLLHSAGFSLLALAELEKMGEPGVT